MPIRTVPPSAFGAMRRSGRFWNALPSGSLERLSDEIYRLWRDHEGQKRLVERVRRFNENFRRSARAQARKKLQGKDPVTLLHAARMERLETLRKRKLSPTCVSASGASWPAA